MIALALVLNQSFEVVRERLALSDAGCREAPGVMPSVGRCYDAWLLN